MSGYETPDPVDKPIENKPTETKENKREETELTTVYSPNEG